MTTVRMARCDMYGGRCALAGHSSTSCSATADTPWEQRGMETCLCEEPSTDGLAFFRAQPDKPYDSFYCGCRGWD